MKELRKSIIYLIFLLFIFYNIERVDIGDVKDVVDMKFYVYVLVAAATMIIFIRKSVARFNHIVGISLWVGLYLIFRIFYNPSESILVGGIYTYLSITEITFLVLALRLAYNTAKHLNDIEATIENITLIGLNDRVMLYDYAEEELMREFYRSRRYNSPLSVLLINPEPGPHQSKIIEEMQNQLSNHYVLVKLARKLSNQIRRTDTILLRMDQNQLAIVCPSTNEKNAETFARLIRNSINNEIQLNASIGLATYPDDAQTLQGLMSHAESTIDITEHPNIQSNDSQSK